MLTPKKTKITCVACRKEIRGARTIIDGQWMCAACTYAHDHPDRLVPDLAPHDLGPGYDSPGLFETTGYIKAKNPRQREHE